MNQRDNHKITAEYELADLSEEQRELLDKVEHTTGLLLVAYDQGQV